MPPISVGERIARRARSARKKVGLPKNMQINPHLRTQLAIEKYGKPFMGLSAAERRQIDLEIASSNRPDKFVKRDPSKAFPGFGKKTGKLIKRKKIGNLTTFETPQGDALIATPEGERFFKALPPEDWPSKPSEWKKLMQKKPMGGTRGVFTIATTEKGMPFDLVLKPIRERSDAPSLALPGGGKVYPFAEIKNLLHVRGRQFYMNINGKRCRITCERPLGILLRRDGQRFVITKKVEVDPNLKFPPAKMPALYDALVKIGINPADLKQAEVLGKKSRGKTPIFVVVDFEYWIRSAAVKGEDARQKAERALRATLMRERWKEFGEWN